MYECSKCGYRTVRELGRCPNCGEWASFVPIPEEMTGKASSSSGKRKRRSMNVAPLPYESPATPLSKLQEERAKENGRGNVIGGRKARIKIAEIEPTLREADRAFGGGKGLMAGSVVLIGGEPGIGKSTLLLQLAFLLHGLRNAPVSPVLYASAEETPEQVEERVQRLGLRGKELGDPFFMTAERLEWILAEAERVKAGTLIVDSIQTVWSEEVNGQVGQPSQVRAVGSKLQAWAKARGVTLFIVGHVTKGGAIAGPKTLEHVVDTVLYLEGERDGQLRILHAVKNRFGPTNEVGLFRMTSRGLVSVDDAAEMFLGERRESVAGSAVTAILEGTRVIPIEIQALVVPTQYIPRLSVQGLHPSRVEGIVAVLSRHTSLRYVAQSNIYVKVIGGLRVNSPAVDLGVAVAIASSYTDRPLPANAVFIGEVGLTGELRRVGRMEEMIRSLSRQFECYAPALPQYAPKSKTGRTQQNVHTYTRLRPLIHALGLRKSGRSKRNPHPSTTLSSSSTATSQVLSEEASEFIEEPL